MMSSRNLSGMSPLVSIVVPVYNTAEYVEECIQSILSQTYENKELILVNDGSTDGSGEICKRYEHLQHVRYIEQENQGATAARRRGVEAATGEWIMFVDSDDRMADSCLSGIMSINASADIIIAANQRNEDSVRRLPDAISKQHYLEMQYTRELSASPCAKMFRRSLFDDKTLSFPKQINRGEDYLMNLMLAINNQKDVYVYKHQIYYVRENLTSTRHTHPYTLDYLFELCKRGDDIVKDHIPSDMFLQQRVKQRLYFFKVGMRGTKFISDPHHPFVKNIRRCLNEAGVWRLMDRWLLSVSSPWAVKSVWNLMRIVKRLKNIYSGVLN